LGSDIHTILKAENKLYIRATTLNKNAFLLRYQLYKTMKRAFLTLAISMLSCLVFAQSEISKPKISVESQEYQDAKMNGILDQFQIIPIVHEIFDLSSPIGAQLKEKKKKGGGIPPKASGCNCYAEPDSTYILAMLPNDDGSSAAITIPFTFCFYGDTVTTMYINNNGNITFGSSLFSYSSTAFPSSPTQIIAPFWADVDTRSGNGQVLYKVTSTAIYINWEGVGYFSQQGDKLNTFQLIITNGLDPAIDGGNVAFCYEDMQWTTGSASSGVNGFGGTPATAGANKGNNLNYFLIALFDHAGTDFDGALGQPDGISWLDNKSFFFDVCAYVNIPPVPNGASSCDTFRVCSIGDTADIQFVFLSPEATQSTSITINPGTLTNLQVVSNTPGNTAYAVLRVPGAAAFVGTHTVQITATDNFSPPGITQLDLTVIIDSTGTTNFNPTLSPVSGCDSIYVDVLGGGYDSYLWDNLLLDTAIYVSSALQNFGVTVEKNGCFKRIDTNFLVSPSFVINLTGPTTLCSGIPTAFYQMPDSLNYGPVTWGLTNQALDSLYSNALPAGAYTVTVTDTLGVCTQSTSFTINQLPPLVLQPDSSFCGSTFNLIVSGGSGNGSWSYFNSPNGQNPGLVPNGSNTLAIFSVSGNYNMVYTDVGCNVSDTLVLTVSKPIGNIFSVGNPFYCPGAGGSLYVVPDSLRFGNNITWGNSPSLNGYFSHLLLAGSYAVTITDTLGLCSKTTSFVVGTQADIVLMADVVICNDTLVMTTNTAGGTLNSGIWSLASGPGIPQYQFNSQYLNQRLLFNSGFGVYVMVYSAANCPNKDTLIVTYSPPPTITFNTIDFFVCPGGTENIQLIDSAVLSSVSWGLTNPTLDALFSANLPMGTHTVTVINQNGCIGDSTFLITSQPIVNLLAHPNSCGDILVLNGNFGNDNGLWTVASGPGSVAFAPVDSIQTIATWSKPGIYTVVYTEPVCQDDDTIIINVVFYPYSEVGNDEGCIGIEQTLAAYSVWENVTDYTWSNGQTGSSATFTQPGDYSLTSTNSCGTHTWYFYYNASICDIDMPNVFTPNGDVINGFYGPIGADPSGFSSFNMKLFNRWGNVMYESNDITKGWDGRSNAGNVAEDGVYFYVIKAKDIDEKDLNKQGFFHLVRE